ncbi:MAG: hypothetical protein V4463_07235 [Pseudomonadota bacterium]
MLSNTQANQIGSELVEQAAARRLAERKRQSLLREAQLAVLRNPKLIAAWLCVTALAIAAALYSEKFQPFGKLPMLAYWGASAILVSPVWFYRCALIRRHIRAKTLEKEDIRNDQ